MTPVVIKTVAIKVVSSYKYLGVLMDKRLDWKENTIAISKKDQSKLFFLMKLRSFNVSRSLLSWFRLICFDLL